MIRKLAVAAVLAAALAVAGSASGGAELSGPRTLRFLDVTQRFIPLEGISQGGRPRIGARFIFLDALYNRGAQFGKPIGARVGSVEGLCTVVTETKFMCQITAHVPDGYVTITGANLESAKVQRFAVTGGVGAYGNARGTVTATSISESKTLVVVHLTP